MRIVSLVPSATEIACALGLREQLVGISHECDYPADIEGLPALTASVLDHGLDPRQIDAAVAEAKLGGRPIYTVDGAQIRALDPDLILTQGVCSVCAVTPQTIAEGLGMRSLDAELDARIVSLGALGFDGILADIQTVADAADVPARGRELVATMRSSWRKLAASHPGSKRPSVLFLEWPAPPWSAGHWVPEQIAVAGGRDLCCRPYEPSERLTWAAVAALDPDVLVVGACGWGLDANAKQGSALRDHPSAGHLRALRNDRLWAVDANGLFSRPGPRVVEGAHALARLLDGAPDLSCTRRV